jgi:hypothetical protein
MGLKLPAELEVRRLAEFEAWCHCLSLSKSKHGSLVPKSLSVIAILSKWEIGDRTKHIAETFSCGAGRV